jgi:hypothetical protein
MNSRVIFLCKHVYSGEKAPKRIFRRSQSTDTDSGFDVTCGSGVDEGLSHLPEETFLLRYPKLKAEMDAMPVGGIRRKVDTVEGPKWEEES